MDYEIRVVYVTDKTIGLRTSWFDGFEVIEELVLATGVCVCVCVCVCVLY